jgi:hypothetical protein
MRLRLGLAALAVAATSVSAPASGHAATCNVVWGSLPKTVRVAPGPPLFNVRAGRHDCYDRLVVDVRGAVQGFNVRYVPVVTGLASGDPKPLRGGAFLEIVVGAGDIDDAGHLTYSRAGRTELVDVTGFRTFRQVAWAESQEALTEIGLGVRARLPFRVFVLPGPGSGSRLVVDVAHHW